MCGTIKAVAKTDGRTIGASFQMHEPRNGVGKDVGYQVRKLSGGKCQNAHIATKESVRDASCVEPDRAKGRWTGWSKEKQN